MDGKLIYKIHICPKNIYSFKKVILRSTLTENLCIAIRNKNCSCPYKLFKKIQILIYYCILKPPPIFVYLKNINKNSLIRRRKESFLYLVSFLIKTQTALKNASLFIFSVDFNNAGTC